MAWVVAGLGAARCVGREVGARPWSEPPSPSQTVADDGSRPLSPPAQLHGRAGGLCTVSEEPPRPPLPPGLLSLGASALCSHPSPAPRPRRCRQVCWEVPVPVIVGLGLLSWNLLRLAYGIRLWRSSAGPGLLGERAARRRVGRWWLTGHGGGAAGAACS